MGKDGRLWRVESDGTSAGTRVFTPSGEDVTLDVMEIRWSLQGGQRAYLELRIERAAIDAKGQRFHGPDRWWGRTSGVGRPHWMREVGAGLRARCSGAALVGEPESRDSAPEDACHACLQMWEQVSARVS